MPLVIAGLVCSLIAGAGLYSLSPNQLLWRRPPPDRGLLGVSACALAGAVVALCLARSPATALMMVTCGLMACCSLLPLGCALLRGRTDR